MTNPKHKLGKIGKFIGDLVVTAFTVLGFIIVIFFFAMAHKAATDGCGIPVWVDCSGESTYLED